MSYLDSHYRLRLDDMKFIPYSVSNNKNNFMTTFDIANDMVSNFALWDRAGVFKNPNAKVLEIYCKSGIFLALIYNRYMEGLRWCITNEKDRSEHIINNILHGICPTEFHCVMSRKTAFGDAFKYTEGNKHIWCPDEFKNESKITADLVRKVVGDMKFDVIIGNPPYNNSAYVDFVNLGYELSTKYCCMITPAKWQTADDDQKSVSEMRYSQFREKIVPHMSHVVFYPDCKDVFDIQNTDGITYFLLDKDVHDKCIVENRCSNIGIYNSIDKRSIINRETLVNAGNQIISYIGEYNKFRFQFCSGTGRFKVFTNSHMPGGGAYAITKDNTKVFYLGISTIYDTFSPDWEKRLNSIEKCTYESDNIEECKSFISWLNSKFTRFFIAINISKLGPITTDDCFRFVPAPAVLDNNGNRVPGKFDHIYTDEELYKTFNLPQKYIDVIEAVVKERK